MIFDTSTITEAILNHKKDGVEFILIDSNQYAFIKYKRKYYRLKYNDEALNNDSIEGTLIKWNPFGYDMAKLNNQEVIPISSEEVDTWYSLSSEEGQEVTKKG